MEKTYCNVPNVPLTGYNCNQLHRKIDCLKLLNTLKNYQQGRQGRYLNKWNVRHNLASFPDMPTMQYLLATSNFGRTLNPYNTDIDMKFLGSWQNPERFMGDLFDSLTNNPFQKTFTPFLNKPFHEFPFTSYGTSLKWPTKDKNVFDKEKNVRKIAKRMSILYDKIAGDPYHLYTKNIATQTQVKQDDKTIISQAMKKAYPFITKSFSDEILQPESYNVANKVQRARSLFKVYFHAPFDSQHPNENVMDVIHA